MGSVGAALGDDVDMDAEIRAVLRRVLPVWICISSTASAIGRMLVIANRLDAVLMPSSDRLF